MPTSASDWKPPPRWDPPLNARAQAATQLLAGPANVVKATFLVESPLVDVRCGARERPYRAWTQAPSPPTRHRGSVPPPPAKQQSPRTGLAGLLPQAVQPGGVASGGFPGTAAADSVARLSNVARAICAVHGGKPRLWPSASKIRSGLRKEILRADAVLESAAAIRSLARRSRHRLLGLSNLNRPLDSMRTCGKLLAVVRFCESTPGLLRQQNSA